MLLTDEQIKEVLYGKALSSNQTVVIEPHNYAIAKAQLKNVVKWAIEERQKLKVKKIKQKTSNPKALANQINLGAKMKALQQVIDKCKE